MAEPSEQHMVKLSSLFCDRYNQSNGTTYHFDCIEKSQEEADFYISDNNHRLSIQHSRIQSFQEFYKSSAQTDKVIQRLNELGKGLKCTVSLDFEQVPTEKEDIENFAFCFTAFLKRHLKINSFNPNFKKDPDLAFLSRIFKHLSKFEILSTDSGNLSFIIGNELWGRTATIQQEVEYLLDNIKKKDDKYCIDSELILLIEIDPLPASGITLIELQKRCMDTKFKCKEIWQILLASEPICDKIYPINSES